MKTYATETPEIKLRKKNGQMLVAQIKSSKDAEIYFREIFDSEQLEVREQAMAIFLNNASNTVGYYLVSIGGMTSTVIDPRTVFRAALECGATSFIMAHNHPSGQLTASDPDITITEKLKQGGQILEIRLLDHLILTADSYLSMADEGLI